MTYVRIIIRDTVFYKDLNTLMLVLLNAYNEMPGFMHA